MLKKVILFAVVAVIVFVLAAVAVLLTKKPKRQFDNRSSISSQPTDAGKQTLLTKSWSRNQCKGEGPVEFKNPPMNLDDVAVILPYGLVVDAHVTPIDHMYFSPAQFNSPRDQYPVYAIADGTIVKISHRGQFVGDQQTGRKTDEYRLDVEYTCTFYSYYDLVTSLSDELAAQVPKDRDKHWSESVRIPIKAGQQIGRIGGQTLDWAVYNTEVILPGLLVPEHYNREAWKIHTDYKAFDYFPATVREQLFAKLARVAEPRLGKIDYDIDGKAIGNWFKEGTNGYEGVDKQPASPAGGRYWDGHLALVYDYIDPTQIRFSIGNFNGVAKQFGVKGNGPDPATISEETGSIKYELVFYEYFNKDTDKPWRSSDGPIKNPASRAIGEVQGTALVQLIDKRKLKVEVFPGKTADQVADFTNNALSYER